MTSGRYWSLHTHSRYSKDDALSPIEDLVVRAVELDYPAIGLTDHGTMAGAAQLYLAGKKHGIATLPGCELYLTSLHESREQRSMHLTLAAYTTEGYRNLVALHNQAQQQFYFRPRLDMADLAAAAEAGRTQGIACATGCRSGGVVRALTERGPEAAEQVAAALAGWFPRTYVELMDHGFKADGMWDYEITSELVAIADRLGLPTILTGDAHYVLEVERAAHDALKTMVSWSTDPDEGRFSGEGYWLKSHAEMYPYGRGFEGLDDLAAAAKVTIPELDTFTLKLPDVTLRNSAHADLMALVHSALGAEVAESRYKPKVQAERAQRVNDEEEVITFTGMWPYLALVHMITSFMEAEGIWYYARGSVAGSLIAKLLGISNTDSFDWSIRMDRFLSGDRSSIPDIDLDIEHERRGEVIAMLEGKGYELVQVGTQMTYGLKKSEDEEGNEKGSLLVKYFSTLKKQGDTETTWETVPRGDKDILFALADRKLISGVGAHPGGYIALRSKHESAALPMIRIDSSGTTVTAFDKGEVESMGFPKMDLLGSKVLTAIKNACMAVTGLDEKGAREFWRAIPMDDKETLKRVGAGKTAGLFQLSGWTNRKVCEQIKPKSTADIVAVQALGRPAPMKNGFTDEFMRRRFKQAPIPQMHADIWAETAESYGLAIYQEQVVGMLRRIGVPPAQMTKLLKAVKASGKEHVEKAKVIVAEALGEVVDYANKRGWAESDVEYLTSCLVEYGAGYSFGKAHSVTYGVAAYITAYLATHHPLEFWTGMLNAYLGSKNSQGDPLEPIYWRAAKDDDVRVREPHVHRSLAGYTYDPDSRDILKGLVSVKGVGHACAEELIAKRPFESLIDLAGRVTGKVGGAKKLLLDLDPVTAGGAILALHDAGALEGIPYGVPIRRAVGRIRKCKTCKITHPTPLEYEDHLVDGTCPQGES